MWVSAGVLFSAQFTAALDDQLYPVEVTAQTLADSQALARLEAPGAVFFDDDFEDESSLDRYFEIRGRDDGRARLVSGPETAHSGRGAIAFAAPANNGQASGSGVSLWFGPEGYEVVYFRRYIRFAADYDQGNLNHTGGGLAGVAGTNMWAGMGKAGIRPTGEDRFTSSFEPWRDWQRYPAPGYMFLYTYWMDMRPSQDGNYWGNFMEPTEERRTVIERGRWYSLEQMIRCNDVGQANGELAAWIDGDLYVHYTGFRWRTTEEVRIKRAGIGIYIHAATRDNDVRYDDVSLSTGYIGELRGAPSAIEETTWGQAKKPGSQ
jgi:hypothetical protein